MKNGDPHVNKQAELTNHIHLDMVDFAPILAEIEPILAEARLLADWAGDCSLDETAAEMLLGIGAKWLRLEPTLNAIGIGASPAWIGGGEEDDATFAAAQCLHDLACAVRENKVWFQYLPGIWPTSLMDLAPEAVMGMPHATFAKRLAVAVELLRKAVAAKGICGVDSSRQWGPEREMIPASQCLDDVHVQTMKQLHRVLRANPEIRRLKPSPQRLLISAADWRRHIASLERRATDALDVANEFVAEARRRKEGIRDRKSQA
jgi:hypothetical protein